MLIQGFITPPLSGVQIFIENESENIKATTTSSNQGTYTYGPVPVGEYKVTAKKDDFILKRHSGYDFKAQRIAKLEVSVVDKYNKVL